MNTRLSTALMHWDYISPLLTPAFNEAEYQALIESLDVLLDKGAADESNPLAGLACMVGDLISTYEQKHYPMPQAMSNIEVLCFFMDRDNLRQQDLPEIGNQAKVSEVLSGRRAINLRQAKALSERFNVDLALFLSN
ncbi:MAG: transcriptional regulator [Methylococcaceae bacterium]